MKYRTFVQVTKSLTEWKWLSIFIECMTCQVSHAFYKKCIIILHTNYSDNIHTANHCCCCCQPHCQSLFMIIKKETVTEILEILLNFRDILKKIPWYYMHSNVCSRFTLWATQILYYLYAKHFFFIIWLKLWTIL